MSTRKINWESFTLRGRAVFIPRPDPQLEMFAEDKTIIFWEDGKSIALPGHIAYRLWLAGGCAIRPLGDIRPVYSWDFY